MDIRIDKSTVFVFDLDDTLYNEIDFLKSAFKQIAKQLEPENWMKLYAIMLSLYRCKQNVFEVIAPKYDLSKNELIKKYREHQPDIELFEGAMKKIEKIKDYSGKLGIITDGRSITQMAKIKALGLSDLMDCIIISEDIGTEKPHINNFKLIEEKFKDSKYYYLADNLKKDFIAPNKMGWTTIGMIDNGLNIHFETHRYINENYMPQNFITSFKDLIIN